VTDDTWRGLRESIAELEARSARLIEAERLLWSVLYGEASAIKIREFLSPKGGEP